MATLSGAAQCWCGAHLLSAHSVMVLVLVHGYQLSQFSAGARSRDPQSGTVGAVSTARTRGHRGPRRRLYRNKILQKIEDM